MESPPLRILESGVSKAVIGAAVLIALAAPPLNGENTMRSVLALTVLIALGASADAATAHSSRTRHHVIDRAGAMSSFAAVPGWHRVPPRPLVHYDDVPSYDDPSKLGGG